MAYNTILCQIFTFLLLLSSSCTQRERLFFRKDYTYLEATRSFYKVHTIPKSWDEGFDICEVEGAPMFYPEDENEANVVIDFWKTKSGVAWAHVGITSLLAAGAFETIDGQSIWEVYHKWGPGEPNNGLGGKPERCVELLQNTNLNDVTCDGARPFICRKKLSTLEWNYFCDMPYTDYEYEKYMGKCYKLHTEPKTWKEAYYTCHAQEAYLAIVNNLKESKHFAKLLEHLKLPAGAIHSGFSKRHRGWKTIKGAGLSESGYAEWDGQQPDDASLGTKTCGSMLSNGKLSNIDCSVKTMFICEHDVIACDICELKK